MRTTVSAGLAIALVPLALATGTRPPSEPCASDYTSFVSKGCFSKSDNVDQLLVYRSALDQTDMTVEECTAECKGNGFRFAGLKYYGVCYCGNVLNGQKTDNSECNFPCSGQAAETCGSNDNSSVWEDPTFDDTAEEASTDEFESLGCYTDDSTEGRALTYQLDVAADVFTPDKCIDTCKAQGYAYAGTEYGGECWCGPNLGSTNKKVDSSECNVACKGDSSLNCGGSLRLNLYYNKHLASNEPCGKKPQDTATTTAPPTTTTSTTTTTSLCTATSTIAPGCEVKCGSWCAPTLPDWKDKSGCLNTAKSCALQVASCFKGAGFPGVVDCFSFSLWCGKIKGYCLTTDPSSPIYGKKDCWKKNHPDGAETPKYSTTMYPCPTTSTIVTATVPTATCAPEATNICTQPSNERHGYGPAKPVAGIALPVVGCNDVQKDFFSSPFKYYTSADTRNCPSFKWDSRPNVCVEACEEQYQRCRDTYVKGCGWSWKGFLDSLKPSSYDKDCASRDSSSEWAKSGCDGPKCWAKGGNDADAASRRCKAQYSDCLAANKKVNPGNNCKTFCSK